MSKPAKIFHARGRRRAAKRLLWSLWPWHRRPFRFPDDEFKPTA